MKYALTSGHATAAVVAMLETERVREAEKQVDQAYRSRDRLTARLWLIDAKHNDSDGDGVCTCGLRAQKCDLWMVVEPERAFLYRWEAQQVERAREGRAHSLPPEHPEYRHSRWA
jgi:hypothetical protein